MSGPMFGVGAPGTISSASGGKIYGFNNINGTIERTVAPANPARKRILFHNISDADMFICPALIQTSGSSLPYNPGAGRGGSFLLYANGGTLTIDGECSGEWLAYTANVGPDKSITVMDTNV